MFAFLAEELLPTLPQTPAQIARFRRGVANADRYRYTDTSFVYGEAAVHVETDGGRYLCFLGSAPFCSCPDFKRHRPCIGTGEIECCKHIVAAYVSGAFVVPAEEPATDAPASFNAPFGTVLTDAADHSQPGWDWEPTDLEDLTEEEQEAAELAGLALCD